jgi:Uma2 family endonuclease
MATVTLPPKSAPLPDDSVFILHDVSWEFYEQFLKEFDERRIPHSYANRELRIMAPTADGVSILDGISWTFYEQYLNEFNERRSPHSYIRGELRIMAPSARHEKPKRLFARFVDEVTAGLELPCHSLGSVTLKVESQEKGAEPDECFLLGNAHLVDDACEYDVNVDPPPDLAIEIDVTSQSLNRLPIYAGAGVPEIWVYDGESVTIGLRRDVENYEVSENSKVLPMLSAKIVSEWIERGRQMPETTWVRVLREWVQRELNDPHSST